MRNRMMDGFIWADSNRCNVIYLSQKFEKNISKCNKLLIFGGGYRVLIISILFLFQIFQTFEKNEKNQKGGNVLSIKYWGTSLVVQWLRIHLPKQGMWVGSLIWELRSHMPWATSLQAKPREKPLSATPTPTSHAKRKRKK